MFNRRNFTSRKYIGAAIATLFFGAASLASAQTTGAIATVLVSSSGMELKLVEPVISLEVTLAGPRGVYFQDTLPPDAPRISFNNLEMALTSGLYKYDIRALSVREEASATIDDTPQQDNGRDSNSRPKIQQARIEHVKLRQNGWFKVRDNNTLEQGPLDSNHNMSRGDADE